MIPMGLNVGSPTGKQTYTLVLFFGGIVVGFLVERIGSVAGCLAEHFGLSVAGSLVPLIPLLFVFDKEIDLIDNHCRLLQGVDFHR